jgi:hypothetical protein
MNPAVKVGFVPPPPDKGKEGKAKQQINKAIVKLAFYATGLYILNTQ